MTRDRHLGGWLSEHPSVDVALALLVVAVHLAVTHIWGRGDVLAWIEPQQRQTLYAAGAGVVSVLGGLAAIGLALYQTAGGARARAVRRHYGLALRKNWRGLLTVTGVSALLCLVALAVDRPDDPLLARFIFEFAMVLWAIRFGRLIWLFGGMLALADLDLTDEPRAPAPPLDQDWRKRRSS